MAFKDNAVELEERVVAINRVTKVVKGGRNMRFAALVVVAIQIKFQTAKHHLLYKDVSCYHRPSTVRCLSILCVNVQHFQHEVSVVVAKFLVVLDELLWET